MRMMQVHVRVSAMAIVAAGVLGCDPPAPTAPVVAGPEFAGANVAPFSATVGPLAVVAPGKIWFSDGLVHVRNQLQVGAVAGDIVGDIAVVANSNVALGALIGVGFGTFSITTADGTWEGSFQGKFDGGLFADKLVAHGTGGLAGLKLKGTFVETGPATNTYSLSGEILNAGG